MIVNIPRHDLNEPAMFYLAANTPLFLLRRLQRTESLLRKIIENATIDDLVESIDSALKADPRNSHEAVVPYILLVALSRLGAVDKLTQYAKRRNSDHRWFPIIADALAKTTQGSMINNYTMKSRPLVKAY